MDSEIQVKYKKLRRSVTSRVFSGVCGGLAEYFNIDPVIVRLIWIALTVWGGGGIIAYLIAILIIPLTNPDEPDKLEQSGYTDIDGRFMLGGLMVLLGILWLVKGVMPEPVWRWMYVGQIWLPIYIISAGVIIYLMNRERVKLTEISQKSENKSISDPTIQRSREDRLFLGICGGIAAKYRLDPVIIRLLWIVGTFMIGGIGLTIYAALYFVIPLRSQYVDEEE